MISITATHRQGVELIEPRTFAIDTEKVVNIRDRGSIAEIEYGETYDRRRQPITYQLTTDRASIDALITGSYETYTQLSLTVIWSDDREHRPTEGTASYTLNLQERYIVDIEDTYVNINGTKTSARRIEFVPGSFVPVVIYVSESYNSLIGVTPPEITTTTTTVFEDGCVILGYLYNWFAVNDARILANEGWHVPTRAEFITLGTYLGGVFVAGGKLKETGLTYWDSPNEGATNETGFNGRGAGYLNVGTGTYSGIGQVLHMWTSTENSSVNAFTGILTWISDELVTGGAYIKQQGSSVRLIKDDDTLAPYVGNDGKVYTTVKIGNQVWMAEDLAETQYANNDPIPHVLDNEEWIELETGALCPYDNDYTKVGCDEVAQTTTTTTNTEDVTTTTTEQ